MRSFAVLASVSCAARTWGSFNLVPDARVGGSGNSASQVKEFECASPDWLLGYYPDEDTCARAVKNANRKWFSYLPATGQCKVEYTTSDDCPEGFQDDGISSEMDTFNFYDAPAASKVDATACEMNVVEVSDPSGTGLLMKNQCGEVLVKTVQKKGINKLCSHDHRLGSYSGNTVVEKWEACCQGILRPQTCDSPKKIVDRVPLSDSGDSWTICRRSKHTSFVVTAPAQPALSPELGLDQCFKATLKSKTVTLESMLLSCDLPQSVVEDLFSGALVPTLDPRVFDTFTLSQFNAGVSDLQSTDGSKDPASERVPVPTVNQQIVDRYSTNNLIGMPAVDVDREVGDRFTSMGLRCVLNLTRRIPDEAMLGGSDPWTILLGSKAHEDSAKKNYIRTLFRAGGTTQEGDPLYPAEVTNFAEMWLVNGVWKDEGETWLGWTHWGSHNVEPVSMTGASFVVRSNALGGLKVRSGFARPGADMYFDESGAPVMIETPDGQQLWRNNVESETWQHWKFVWRSSVVLYVTVIDHLWATHMGASNSLSGATRESLPAAHPLRRLLSMFTYNAIEVNQDAFDTLISSEGILQRSSPFLDFTDVAQAARKSIPSLEARFGRFVDADIKASLPKEIQSIPFLSDGQLLFDALRKLVEDFFGVYGEWCRDGTLVDPDISFFFDRMTTWSMYAEDHMQTDAVFFNLFGKDGETVTCDGFKIYLTTHLFHVSGYHRHVGQVFDSVADPDWTAFSWRENQAFASPQQSVLTALISAGTGIQWPKISEDYSFMMQGIAKSSEAINALKDFRSQLDAIKVEIDNRNQDRPIPYRLQHPDDVETAVSV